MLTNPNYRAIGVGRSYSASSTYQWYWAADFGGIVDTSAPGQIGYFQVRAPAAPGTYRLEVRGVIDGTTWLEDQGIYFTITVR